MAFCSNFDLRLFENKSLKEETFSGLVERDFRILEGSRLVLSIRVTSLIGTLNVSVGNDFEADGDFNNLDSFAPITSVGTYKLILTDFHSLFKLKMNVGAGSATLRIGVTSDDNSHNKITVENAEIEVNLDANNDSVTAIVKDEEGDALDINPDGSINVNILTENNAPGLKQQYDEVLSVPAAVETTVLTVVVPSGQKRLQKIEVSGSNVATIKLKLNTFVINKKYLWHGDFNTSFDFESFFSGLLLQPGDIVEVTALHNRPHSGDFNATAWYI